MISKHNKTNGGKKIRSLATIALASIIGIAATTAGAANITWGRGAEGDWFDTTNWYPHIVPAETDTVTIPSGITSADKAVTVDGGSLDFINSTSWFTTLQAGVNGYAEITGGSSDISCEHAMFGIYKTGEFSGAFTSVNLDISAPIIGASGTANFGFDGSLENKGSFTTQNPALGLWYDSVGRAYMLESDFVCTDVLSIGVYGSGDLTLGDASSGELNDVIMAQGPGSTATLKTCEQCNISGAVIAGLAGHANIEITGETTMGELLMASSFMDNIGSAYMYISGDYSSLEIENNAYIGEHGDADLIVFNGASISARDCYMGISANMTEVYNEQTEDWETVRVASDGYMNLSDSTGEFCNLFVGLEGKAVATAEQNATLNVQDRIYLARNVGGEGTLYLSSGTVNADELIIGGGSVILGDEPLNTEDDIFNTQTGTLSMLSNSKVNLTGGIKFGMFSTINANSGKISLDSAYWKNVSYTKLTSDLEGLRRSQVSFTGQHNTIEADSNGRAINQFAMITVEEGSTLTLQDEFDNTPYDGGSDKLYVRKLVLMPNAVVDLNGLELVCLDIIDNGGAIVTNGGTLTDDSRILAIDFNQDGIVSIHDFLILKSEYGQSASGTVTLRADLDDNGIVNIFDFLIFKDYYNRAQ